MHLLGVVEPFLAIIIADSADAFKGFYSSDILILVQETSRRS
jgi:hypothetical protein